MRIFYLIALLTVIGSCTITKRFHNPGWHVEWKGKLSADKNQAIQNEVLPNEQVNINEQAHLNVENQQSSNEKYESYEMELGAVASTSVDAHLIESTANESSIENKDRLEKNAKNSLISEDEPNVVDDRELNPRIKISLCAAVLSSVFLPFLLVGIGMYLLLFLSGLFTMIYAIIGIVEMKKNPGKWKGKGLAIFLLILGIAEVLFVAIVFNMFVNGTIDSMKEFAGGGWGFM